MGVTMVRCKKVEFGVGGQLHSGLLNGVVLPKNGTLTNQVVMLAADG